MPVVIGDIEVIGHYGFAISLTCEEVVLAGEQIGRGQDLLQARALLKTVELIPRSIELCVIALNIYSRRLTESHAVIDDNARVLRLEAI